MKSEESIVPKYAVATPERVGELLKVSPEREKELREEQDKLLDQFRSKSGLTPAQRRIARGIELERIHRQSGDKNGLAEALAQQGRYAEAVETAVNPDLKAELEEKLAAVERPDDDCLCDSHHQSQSGHLLPNQFVLCEGYSEKHKKDVSFIKCMVCGVLNARALLPHLESQRQARRKSESGAPVRAEKFFKKA